MRFYQAATIVCSLVVPWLHLPPAASPQEPATKPPYPPSPLIAGITWDWKSHHTAAPGSDLWADQLGETEAITLLRNERRESRRPTSRVGIRIGARAREIQLTDNQTEGFAVPVADLRKRT
jgi:hypothetical protein